MSSEGKGKKKNSKEKEKEKDKDTKSKATEKEAPTKKGATPTLEKDTEREKGHGKGNGKEIEKEKPQDKETPSEKGKGKRMSDGKGEEGGGEGGEGGAGVEGRVEQLAFSLFDGDSDGLVRPADVEPLLRNMGNYYIIFIYILNIIVPLLFVSLLHLLLSIICYIVGNKFGSKFRVMSSPVPLLKNQ
jgi:hypothetical protein